MAPAELEAELLTHPGIVDAAVVGVEDSRSGQLPQAYVVLREGARVTAEDVQTYIKGIEYFISLFYTAYRGVVVVSSSVARAWSCPLHIPTYD